MFTDDNRPLLHHKLEAIYAQPGCVPSVSRKFLNALSFEIIIYTMDVSLAAYVGALPPLTRLHLVIWFVFRDLGCPR